MKSDLFDAKMRSFEKTNDPIIGPEMNTVVRIDGRNFSRLTRKILKLEPYSERLAGAMRYTVEHLMEFSGFPIIFGYTQSDEISLLMDKQKALGTFAGKVRKYNSLLAAETSAIMTLEMMPAMHGKHISDMPITFDARTIQIPTKELVIDYFNWRRADSEKNCLNMLCHHVLTDKLKLTSTQAQSKLDRKTVAWKNEFLHQNGINFDDVEAWKKRGMGFYWEMYDKIGENGKTGESIGVKRRKLGQTVLPKTSKQFSKFLNKLFNSP